MEENTVFYDPKIAPFQIFGLYNPCDEAQYKRLPDDVANDTSPGVAGLYHNTAGGRIRFATDSSYIVLKAKLAKGKQMSHCTPMLQNGFDLYIDGSEHYIFAGCFKFDTDQTTDYEVRLGLTGKMKELTLNMPLYGSVLDIKIGLDAGAKVLPHTPYAHTVPIVYYGSSITQGACASRPGLCYQAYISRRFDCDYINLGFSGNAKGEDAIANYMAGLNMCAFVSDYDHNAPDVAHLQKTHYPLYEKIRAKHPDIPYFMLSRPNFFFGEGDLQRRDVIMESYLTARKNGDKNVYFIDGASLFSPDLRGECTTDNCHPSDIGFKRMADVIGDALFNVMKW